MIDVEVDVLLLVGLAHTRLLSILGKYFSYTVFLVEFSTDQSFQTYIGLRNDHQRYFMEKLEKVAQ